MATQSEVAKKAGVSFITVSRVINNKGYVKKETRELVMKAIQELNYYTNHIGRALHMKTVNTLGIAIPVPQREAVHETEYFNQLLAGIESFSMEKQYDMLLSTYRQVQGQTDLLRPFFQKKVDGLILITPDMKNPQMDAIRREKIPCVIIGDRVDDASISFVDSDNNGGIRQVIDYLVLKGHRKIAFLKGTRTARNSLDRYMGFVEAMEDKGLKIRPEWVFEGDFTPLSGHQAIGEIASWKKRPDVLVCSNDLSAIGALAEAKARNIAVPDDMAITGFDSIGLTAYTDPGLTTVYQPLYDMGKAACELLFRKIANPNEMGSSRIFPVKLVERKSA